MRLKVLSLALLAISSGWIFTGAACTPKLLVPPARLMNGESPRVLPVGAISAGLEGGSAAISEISVGALSGNAVVGTGFNMDLRFSATGAWMSAVSDSKDDPEDYFQEAGRSKTLQAAQMRLKWNPFGNDFASVTGGAGAGRWEGRRYYSLEAGYVVGFENPYFIPYLNYRWTKNVPLDRDTVHWGPSVNWEDYSKAPLRSYGREGLLGFRIPLRIYPGPRRRSRESNLPYLKVEAGWISLEDASEQDFGFMLALGLQIPLRYSVPGSE